MERVGAIFVLFSRLKEKPSEIIIKDENQPIAEPKIVFKDYFLDSVYSVVVDNQRLCSTKDFIHAVKLLMATYYIFNIAYPKPSEGTLTFIQKGLINLQDRAKMNKKVANLLLEINQQRKKIQ